MFLHSRALEELEEAAHNSQRPRTMLTRHSGLPAARSRDGTIHAPDRTPPIYDPPQNVYLHVRCRPSIPQHPLTPHSSESPLVAKLQYGMKITFIFILILFIDSVNRVYRVQVELAETNKQQGGFVSHSPIFIRVTNKPAEPPSSATSAWKFRPESSTPNVTCTSAASPSSSR